MKKYMSRMLALLLTLMLLVSGIPSVFAETVVELGSKEDVEGLLLEAILEIFPMASLEDQYIYASYYEQKGLTASVDALLGTLSSEQLVAFTDFKAENECQCYDAEGNLICEDAETCACLCHKIDAFIAQMEALIEYLERLDVDQAVEHIRKLRFNDALGLYNGFGVGPVVTAGPGSYPDYPVQETAVESDIQVSTTALDEEGEVESEENPLSETGEALKTLNTIQEKAEDNSEIGTLVNEVMNQYVTAENEFQDIYTNNADFASFALARTQSDAVQVMTSAINEDISGMLKNATGGIAQIDPDIQDNIVLKLFNYDKDYLNDSPLKFSQNAAYGNYLFKTKGDRNSGFIESYSAANESEPSAVDGEGTVGVTGGYIAMKPVIEGGFPKTQEGQSLDYLFSENSRSFVGKTEHGTGLFTRNDKGYYEYDSKDNAAYFDNGKFKLYNAPVTPAYAPIQYADTKDDDGNVIGISDIQAGNFLPFNEPIGNVVEYEKAGKYRFTVPVDMWFGLSMEFDFFMPRGGLMGSEAMIFDFYGDDDVWVYIDDILVLDIGGTHGSLKGTINFANGEVSYSNTGGEGGNTQTIDTNLRSIYENSGKYTDAQITEMFGDGNTFLDYTPHNFKFYYLERGGNISYCKLKFNITTLPAGSLTVNKDIVGNITETTDVEYNFQIKQGNEPVSGATYQVTTTATGTTSTDVTGDDGTFKLKGGQTATFLDLPSQKVYTISEVKNDYTYCTDWVVKDSSEQTNSDAPNALEANVFVAPEDSDAEASFITALNTLKTTSLMVQKNVMKPRPADADNVYTFKMKVEYGLGENKAALTSISGTKNAGDMPTTLELQADNNGEVLFGLKANEAVTFTNLPIGATVTITEVDTPAAEGQKAVNIGDFSVTMKNTNFAEGAVLDGYTFTGVVLGETGENTGAEVTFTNEPRIYDLEIEKKGLAMNIDPNSSTLYSVECEQTGVKMVVAINGNKSVTIKDLPVGEYTVSELTDWSWRYTSSNVQNGKITLDGENDKITFTNTRDKDKWLDGEAYVANKFNNGSSTGGSDNE